MRPSLVLLVVATIFAAVASAALPKYANGSRENSKNYNSKGTDVQTLQTVIGSRCGTADGIFGVKTEACVKWFQGVRKLTQDGIAGKKTWASILEAVTATPIPN